MEAVQYADTLMLQNTVNTPYASSSRDDPERESSRKLMESKIDMKTHNSILLHFKELKVEYESLTEVWNKIKNNLHNNHVKDVEKAMVCMYKILYIYI